METNVNKKPFKSPDLNAPRFRPKKLNLTNQSFYEQFVKDNPKMVGEQMPDIKDFKRIISTFNGKIWEKVIEERDGVQLPEQLGFLFIGTCNRSKENIDFHNSIRYGVKLQNKNWESDDYMAKIFYTNYETKYRFRNSDLWGFSALRDFKRTLAQVYPNEWKKYVQVDNLVRVSRLFRLHRYKHKKREEEKDVLTFYDEFNLDDPWQGQT